MYKKEICQGCSQERRIVNRHFKLCLTCNEKRLRSNKVKKVKIDVKEIKNKSKDHHGRYCCTGCGKKFRSITASHIIPVGLRKDLENDINNIRAQCFDCHNLWEHGQWVDKMKIFTFEQDLAYIQEVWPEYFNRIKSKLNEQQKL